MGGLKRSALSFALAFTFILARVLAAAVLSVLFLTAALLVARAVDHLFGLFGLSVFS